MALAQMLARLRDARGRIRVPGFYQDVQPLSAFERRQFRRLPFKEAAYKKLLGVPALFGERGFSPLEHRSARPTLEINGLTSGYQGEGSKTIVPAWASAKLTMRLVPNQDPARILKQVCRLSAEDLPPHRATRNWSPVTGLTPTWFPRPASWPGPRCDRSGSRPDANLCCCAKGAPFRSSTSSAESWAWTRCCSGSACRTTTSTRPTRNLISDCYERGQLMSALLWQELARRSSR